MKIPKGFLFLGYKQNYGWFIEDGYLYHVFLIGGDMLKTLDYFVTFFDEFHNSEEGTE